MRQLQHSTRSFPARNTTFIGKCQWAANAVLVTAAFVFVGAVILGVFP